LVNTNLGRRDKGLGISRKILITLLKPVFTPMKDAIKIGLFLAVSKKTEKLTGRYLKRIKDKIILNNSLDPGISGKLCEICET